MRPTAVLLCLGVALCPRTSPAQAGSRPLTVAEFLALERAGDPQISPDGRWVAYTVTTTDLPADRRATHVWLAASDGGRPRRVTTDTLGGRGPRWAPDGATLAYVTARGTPQIRLYTPATRRTRRLTTLSTGADGVVWSPTGTHVAFVSEVYPDCANDACNRTRMRDAAAREGVRIYDELLFRHWNAWQDDLVSHLFVVSADGGEPVDVTAGRRFDTPVPPFGGAEDYAFAYDGQTIYYTTKLGADRAWHTNTDVFEVPIAGGPARNVTPALEGAERHPSPSPDGRWLAYLSQERPGFEADRWRLMVRDLITPTTREVTRGFDRSVDGFTWLPDSRGIVFAAQDRQRSVLYHADLDGRIREVLRWGNTSQFSLAGDGRTVALLNDAMHRPGQVYVWQLGGRDVPRPLTQLNAAVLSEVRMRPAEEINWVGAEGRTIWGMLLKPPQYRPGERYPLLVLIHGGPQGAWLDQFHSRWNAQLFAAPGYVTVLLNPRGSTGFGQTFVDQISRDWGGRVFNDIMAGVEHAARFPFVDSTRMAAAGGSYGGYMVNWINGHSTRFDALISHAGVYHLESFYGATEELWFPEWEFDGPPWVNRTHYERWSPHRMAHNFRTPTLVLHGALDYRVPDAQGFQMYTALRRQGVPARLVYFPDEGHWIGRPRNQEIWWREVHDWLARYLRPAER